MTAAGGLAVAASACGASEGRERGASPPTDETEFVLTAVNPDIGRARYELRCDPPAGDVADPAQACRALAADPSLVTDPEPVICRGGPHSHWRLHVVGRVRGEPFTTDVATCWRPRMKLIDLLTAPERPRVLTRRKRLLEGGQAATYSAGELEPGDLVVCHPQGKRLDLAVGFPGDGPRYVGWDPTPSVSATIETLADGRVRAECDTPAARARTRGWEASHAAESTTRP